MKEHPILFSAPMVRAILDGRKTVTRRVVKPQPVAGVRYPSVVATPRHNGLEDGHGRELRSRFGMPGDRLWVRETWAPQPGKEYTLTQPVYEGGKDPDKLCYRADEQPLSAGEDALCYGVSVWRPSIHMPRWASRLQLDVVSVRLERLQEITEGDAFAEGVEANPYVMADGTVDDMMSISAIANFAELWESINGKRPGCAWFDNPWVWRVEFTRVTP